MASKDRISTRANPQNPKVQVTSDPEKIPKQARANQKKKLSTSTRKPPVPIFRKKSVETPSSLEAEIEIKSSQPTNLESAAESSEVIQKEVAVVVSEEQE